MGGGAKAADAGELYVVCCVVVRLPLPLPQVFNWQDARETDQGTYMHPPTHAHSHTNTHTHMHTPTHPLTHARANIHTFACVCAQAASLDATSYFAQTSRIACIVYI